MFKLQLNNASITNKLFWYCILLFLVLSFLIFGKSIGNKYSMDDDFVMYKNEQIHKGIKAIPEIFTTTYVVGAKASYEYRPIVKAVYAIEYQLFGENTKAFHALSILFYFLLVSYLFYTLIRLLQGYHYLFSLIVTLLFLVHPLHTEVVMSLKNLDVILSMTFALMSLNFYVKFVENNKWYNVLFGLICLLLALLSKKDSMPFMILIPLTIWFFRTVSKRQLVVVTTSLLLSGVTLLKVSSAVFKEKTLRIPLYWENPLYYNTKFWTRMPQGMHSIYFYVKMFLFPHPLISYYGYNQVPLMKWTNIAVWIILILLCVLLYYVIKNLKTKSIHIYGILFFLISISMFTNIVVPVVGIVGERFAFIASLGLCIVVGWAIFKVFKSDYDRLNLKLSAFRSGIFVTIGVIVFLFSIKSYSRNAAWYDSYTLYEADVKTATESAHTYSLLAAAAVQKIRDNPGINQQERQRYANIALKNYKESLRILPDYITSNNNIGMVYQTFFNKADLALPYLKKAVELDTAYVEAYFNLATCQATLKQYDEAEKNYLRVIKLDPNFSKAYQSLSAMYSYLKQTEKIISLNEDAIKKDLKTDVPYINLGNVYYLEGDTAKAVFYLEKAIEIIPNNKSVNQFLLNYFKNQGDKAKIDLYTRLLSKSAN